MTQTQTQTQTQAQRSLDKALALMQSRLRAIGQEALSQKILLHWNTRLRSTAGRAWPEELRIELNPYLLSVENSEAEIQRTTLHETAHLLAHVRFAPKRIQAHGAEWKQACKDLGIPGESATHRLPLPRHSQRKQYRYQCPHCQQIFERARKIKRPSACASCCKKYANNQFDQRFVLQLFDSTK